MNMDNKAQLDKDANPENQQANVGSGAMVYVAFDSDNVGDIIGQAILNDDKDTLNQASQAIEHGAHLLADWVESVGGHVISFGSDELTAEIPHEVTSQLEEIRSQYEQQVGASVSVGIGNSLSESGKALISAKQQGKNQIVQYSQGMEEQVQQTPDQSPDEVEQPNPEEGISSPNLNYDIPEGDEPHDLPSDDTDNVNNIPPTDNIDPNHNPENETPSPEMGIPEENLNNEEPQENVPQEFPPSQEEGEEEPQEPEEVQEDSSESTGNEQELKDDIAEALLIFRDHKDLLDSLEQENPELFHAMITMLRSMIDMAKELNYHPEGFDEAEQIEEKFEDEDQFQEGENNDDSPEKLGETEDNGMEGDDKPASEGEVSGDDKQGLEEKDEKEEDKKESKEETKEDDEKVDKSETIQKARVDEGLSLTQKIQAREDRNIRFHDSNPKFHKETHDMLPYKDVEGEPRSNYHNEAEQGIRHPERVGAFRSQESMHPNEAKIAFIQRMKDSSNKIQQTMASRDPNRFGKSEIKKKVKNLDVNLAKCELVFNDFKKALRLPHGQHVSKPQLPFGAIDTKNNLKVKDPKTGKTKKIKAKLGIRGLDETGTPTTQRQGPQTDVPDKRPSHHVNAGERPQRPKRDKKENE